MNKIVHKGNVALEEYVLKGNRISILEGVYARYVNGNESSPNAKDIGNDVVPLAKATYDIIKNI